MKDICMKCENETELMTKLSSIGIASGDNGEYVIDGDWMYIGKVIASNGSFDADTGDVITDPTYYDGEYAIYRADENAAHLLSNAASLSNASFSIVDPPDGITTFGGEWIIPDMTSIISSACDKVDSIAESLCNKVITSGSAQMARYTRKLEQAQNFLNDSNPTEENYPSIYNEVGITADTAEGVATVILEMANQWWSYGDSIEKIRLSSKKKIQSSTSQYEVDNIINSIEWPSYSGE